MAFRCRCPGTVHNPIIIEDDDHNHGQEPQCKRPKLDSEPPVVGLQEGEDEDVSLLDRWQRVLIPSQESAGQDTQANRDTNSIPNTISNSTITLIPKLLLEDLVLPTELQNITVANSEQHLALKIDEAAMKWGAQVVGEDQKYLLCLLARQASTPSTGLNNTQTITVELWFKNPVIMSIFQDSPFKLTALPDLTAFNYHMHGVNVQTLKGQSKRQKKTEPTTWRKLLEAELDSAESKLKKSDQKLSTAFSHARKLDLRVEIGRKFGKGKGKKRGRG